MAAGHHLIAALLCTLLATPALAEKGGDHGNGHGKEHGQGQGHGKPEKHGHGERGQGKDHGGKGHGGRDDARRPEPVQREVIVNYFQAQPLRPAALPPGIAKKIRPGHALPPEFVYQPAPVVLVQQVPACRNGWECILVGTDMLILDAVHRTVAEVVSGVVR